MDNDNDIIEILKAQQRVNVGLQQQLASLGRLNELLWSALSLVAGDDPRPEVQELSAHAKREIEELRKLYSREASE